MQVIRERTLAQRKISLQLIAEYLRTHPCVDCGISGIRVLDFDHRPDTVKRAGVPVLAKNGYSTTVVLGEIAKCDVRCRNCHAIVTYERMGDNWRSDAIENSSTDRVRCRPPVAEGRVSGCSGTACA